MKNPGIRFSIARLASVIALAWAGCTQLDTTPPGDPDRVLKGAVHPAVALPAGAEIVVRLIEPPGGAPRIGSTNERTMAGPPGTLRAERVLGEFTRVLETGTTQPVPFQVEYHADDALLRRGLNLDVRVSFDGKVRLRTVDAHAVTLRSSPFEQEVKVQSVQ